MRFLFILFLLTSFLIIKRVSAQTAIHSDKKIAIYNIGTGAVIGAIGSALNKKKGEKVVHAILNGAWKGAIGGTLTYTGKKMTKLIVTKENISYAWPAKIIHSTGSSIIENAAANRGIISNWAIEVGFLRVDIGNHSSLKILPVALAGSILNSKNGEFNLKRSLQTGTIYFSSTLDKLSYYRLGVTKINSIAVNEECYKDLITNKDRLITTSHELIHTFQSRELHGINNVINLSERLKGKNVKTFRKYIYLDLPYSDITYLYNSFYLEKEAHSISE